MSRLNMRFVPARTVKHQIMQAEHCIRARLIKARTARSNETRGLLAELGIVIPVSLGKLRRALPEILEDGENGLPWNFRRLLVQLSSSGGKIRLGGISKHGDKYGCMLLIHGVRSALNAAKNKEDGRSRWEMALTWSSKTGHLS